MSQSQVHVCAAAWGTCVWNYIEILFKKTHMDPCIMYVA